MIDQAQPHWSYYTNIDESEIEENDTDYDIIEPSSEVGPHPIVTNTSSTLVIYNPVAEFPELFPEEKPTELPTLREPLEIMQHRIDVIPNSVWKPRFPSTYNQFKDQIHKKIITELETGRIVPSKSSNSIGMFTQPKRDKLQEARFLLDYIPRNLVRHKDKTPMPSMEPIKDFIGSRPFRSNLDLTDVLKWVTCGRQSRKEQRMCERRGACEPAMEDEEAGAIAEDERSEDCLINYL